MRVLVAALVLLNLVLLAWNSGWLSSPSGDAARAGREPERLARQVRPDSVRVVVDPGPAAPPEAASAPASAAAGG